MKCKTFGRYGAKEIFSITSILCYVLIYAITLLTVSAANVKTSKANVSEEVIIEENKDNCEEKEEFEDVKISSLSFKEDIDLQKSEEISKKDTITYTVVKGDSFWTISEKVYDTSIYYLALQEYNNYSNKTLSVGDILNIPSIDNKEFIDIFDKQKTISVKQQEIQQPQTIVQERPSATEGYNILKTYSVPSGHSFKSYTNYRLLSSSSAQGKLQTQAHTDPTTGIRMVGDYYCAALGTYYEGEIGDKYLVTLSGGNNFKMILCDVKSDKHTNSTHQYTSSNGCVIEFYVDYSVLNSYIKRMGNISYIDGFAGDILKIEKLLE